MMRQIVFIVAVVFTIVVSLGCVRIIDSEGKDVRVVQTQEGLAGVKELEPVQELHALVKGSIYLTGEAMSVFGACLTAEDEGFPGSSAVLSAWYPNGTQFMFNNSMTQLQTGYFLWTGPMSAVQGTYLTELSCKVGNVTARAFGEWQNPYWVQTINNTYGAVQNLSNNTENWFNITWDKVESVNSTVNTVYADINTTLYYVASVANGSVDRNDSYLAWLLQLIVANAGIPQNNSLVVVEYPQTDVGYWLPWRIEVVVFNEYGQVVTDGVGCLINVTNVPGTVNGSMHVGGASSAELIPSAQAEDYFYWVEDRIQTLGAFNWSVSCVYQ